MLSVHIAATQCDSLCRRIKDEQKQNKDTFLNIEYLSINLTDL